MRKFADPGRIFYGVAIAVMGIQTVIDRAFPYMLIPPKLSWRPNVAAIPYFFGALLAAAGLCIIFKKRTHTVSLLLGGLLMLVFVFYYLPFQFMATNFTTFHEWENAEKELDLACGAFIAAGLFVEISKSPVTAFLSKLIPVAPILYAITIISYGVFHFQLAPSVAEYVPAWVPARLFWAYFAGAALVASGLAIIVRIKMELAAFLLGTMIFIWFAVLHMPRVIMSPPEYLASEISSACLALAYSGIAFMIAARNQ